MTDRYRCPLCTETYTERTDLRVHLEVTHRKSEIVTTLLDTLEADDGVDGPTGDNPTVVDEERSAPSAD